MSEFRWLHRGLADFAWLNRDRIDEVDLNPNMVRPAGGGSVIVDALIMSRKAEEEAVSDVLLRYGYETDDKVGIITLDRPAKLDAMNAELKEQLQAAFKTADADAATRVVVLRGGGTEVLRRLRHRRWRSGLGRVATPSCHRVPQLADNGTRRRIVGVSGELLGGD
jgi:hypothetical protein